MTCEPLANGGLCGSRRILSMSLHAPTTPAACARAQTGLKIVVDAGNGAGGFFATEVGAAGRLACLAMLELVLWRGATPASAPHIPPTCPRCCSQVLAPLGADIAGSQFLDPDGSFPNHIPNPEHPSAMAAGAKATTAAGADLGIVFDTDVDR